MSDWAQFVTVYRVLEWSEEVCDLGAKHRIAVYAEKHLRFTKDVRTNHALTRGYSDSEAMNPIYADSQGRRYNTAMPVDYHATRQYIDPDGHYWEARKPNGMRVDEFEKRKVS
jgi:hypothetical protein